MPPYYLVKLMLQSAEFLWRGEKKVLNQQASLGMTIPAPQTQDNDKNSHWQSQPRARSPTYSAMFCYHWQVMWLPESFLYQYLHLLSFSGKVSSNAEQDWQVLNHFETTVLDERCLIITGCRKLPSKYFSPTEATPTTKTTKPIEP